MEEFPLNDGQKVTFEVGQGEKRSSSRECNCFIILVLLLERERFYLSF